MKKFFKIAGISLGVIVVLVIGFAIFVQFRGIPTYDKPDALKLKVEITPERVDNGERIASMLCVQCHSGPDNRLIGKLLEDVPGEFGEIYSKNITQDKDKGIGNWTDGELYHFLRTGVRPDGRYIPPYMPKFPLMADEDLLDIIAWLRSDRYGVQPSTTEAPESSPSYLVKVLSQFAFKPLPLPSKPIDRPDTNNTLALGKYVFDGMIVCYACHSKDFKTVNELVPEKSEGYCGGGNPLLNMKREVVVSSNLTPDETGIGGYTEEEFVQAVKYGRKKDGGQLRYPMVPHTRLTDKEAKAIYAYLRTVPKIKSGKTAAR